MGVATTVNEERELFVLNPPAGFCQSGLVQEYLKEQCTEKLCHHYVMDTINFRKNIYTDIFQNLK